MHINIERSISIETDWYPRWGQTRGSALIDRIVWRIWWFQLSSLVLMLVIQMKAPNECQFKNLYAEYEWWKKIDAMAKLVIWKVLSDSNADNFNYLLCNRDLWLLSSNIFETVYCAWFCNELDRWCRVFKTSALMESKKVVKAFANSKRA
jgi:hypothetical protein